MSRWRAVKALTVSLSAAWITAVGCVQGLTAKEGVFLRTAKKGSDKHPLRRAFRLSAVETILAVALIGGAISLLFRDDPPLLLICIMIPQGLVFACSPITAIWNTRAQRYTTAEYRKRHEERMAKRANRRPIPAFATPAFFWMVVFAVIAATVVAAAVSPSDLAPVPAPTIGPILGVGG